MTRSPCDPHGVARASVLAFMPRRPRPRLSLFPLLCAPLALVAAPPVGQAAPPAAEGPAPANDEAEASAGASFSTEGGETRTSRRLSSRGRGDPDEKWITRWAPENNMWELGVFGGVWFPHRELELFGPDDALPNQGFKRYETEAIDVGARVGYYPLRFVGAEVEGAFMPTRTNADKASAFVFNPRAHVVGQLGFWSITPFVLLGTGALGVVSDRDALGNDVDISVHYGGGVKFFINRWVMMRVDFRDIVTNRAGVGEGSVRSPEILLGLSLTLGRKKDRDAARSRKDDRDGDGIKDDEDYCPDVFGEAPRGCPQVCLDDSDGDGIIDPEDACPLEPETRNGFEDDDGCPDEAPPEYADLTGVMEGVNFDTNKDTIQTQGREKLDAAAAVLNKYPELRVEVSGHTDSKGGYKYNVDLSRRRAESVKRYLIEHGVDAGRIETRGAGPDEPIDTNDTETGRARNRRIEFKLLEPEGGAGAKIETKPGM